MKKLIRLLLIVLSVASVSQGASWVTKNDIEIKGIISDADGGDYFLLIPANIINADKTISNLGTYGVVYIPSKDIYAQLLAAQVNGKTIKQLQVCIGCGNYDWSGSGVNPITAGRSHPK